MKKILITLALLVATTMLLAQAPQKFSYQGVIRDAAGNLVRNAPVGVRVSILKNSTEGVAVYCETHRQTTNANGLLTLTIGNGTVVGGEMAAIDWADGPYFLKTETDITGGSNYTLVGAQQLLSVPYALYAGSTTNAFSGDYNDLSNKPEIPQVPTDVSAFTNDAGYISNKECDNLSYCQLVSQLTKLQNTVDSLKEKVQEGGGTGHGPVGNDAQPCPGTPTVTDVDGNTYNTVQIGEQCWMKENLRTTMYADGISITKKLDSGAGLYYCSPNYKIRNGGLLYNWYAATRDCSSDSIPSGVQGVCPIGWHVPSKQEWIQLSNYLHNKYPYLNMANALLSEDVNLFIANQAVGYNSVGFSALPVGCRYQNGTTYSYESGGFDACFWSSTIAFEKDSQRVPYSFNLCFIDHTQWKDQRAYYRSVRCLRD
jgi:uncharacterized protein (TIGR02145 family)